MKQDDLTQISNIGQSRMERFNDLGITTIQQLHAMPLEELAKIETIGAFYAEKIKDGVAEYYARNNITPPAVTSTAKAKDNTAEKSQKAPEEGFDFKKGIKNIQKRIKSINKKVQPLLEKKYQELYSDFEKNCKQLKAFRKTIDSTYDAFSQKALNELAKKADELNAKLKNIKKKPGKAQYKKIRKEIQSLIKSMKKICS